MQEVELNHNTTERLVMNEKDIEKVICYGVGVLVIYYIISHVISYIIFGLVGMIVWRIYKDRHKF